jgi:hypothetical protein
MAKQSFSVGQVLTAAQMTSLQDTAMGGGAASSKSANYVLVAADAGTTISMTSTSSTTITVNTGLFSAGDTVFIQNLGSATCTITAGTATVNTAGSLILPQYDAGILYFVSASSAIFYDYIQVGATSPLTTKGDLYTFGSSDTRLGVGANGTVLTADSAETTGLKWATAAAGGGMTLINTGGTTLTGASVSITSIPSTYKNLQLLIRNYKPANDTTNLRATFNSTAGYNGVYVGVDENRSPTGDADLLISRTQDNSVAQGVIVVQIFDYADTNTFKTMFTYAITNNATTSSNVNFMCGQSVFGSTTAISSIQIFPASGNFTSGTAFLYGVS